MAQGFVNRFGEDFEGFRRIGDVFRKKIYDAQSSGKFRQIPRLVDNYLWVCTFAASSLETDVRTEAAKEISTTMRIFATDRTINEQTGRAAMDSYKMLILDSTKAVRLAAISGMGVSTILVGCEDTLLERIVRKTMGFEELNKLVGILEDFSVVVKRMSRMERAVVIGLEETMDRISYTIHWLADQESCIGMNFIARTARINEIMRSEAVSEEIAQRITELAGDLGENAFRMIQFMAKHARSAPGQWVINRNPESGIETIAEKLDEKTPDKVQFRPGKRIESMIHLIGERGITTAAVPLTKILGLAERGLVDVLDKTRTLIEDTLQKLGVLVVAEDVDLNRRCGGEANGGFYSTSRGAVQADELH